MAAITSPQLNRSHLGTFTTAPAHTRENNNIRVIALQVLSQFLDKTDYPHLCWENRQKPMITMLKNYDFDIAAVYEFNVPQLKTFQKVFGATHKLIGYSSELGLPMEEVQRLCQEADEAGEKRPHYGEFVGCMISSHFDVKKTVLHQLPNGARHKRICVEVQVIQKATQKTFAVFSSHLDHLKEESRVESGEIILNRIAHLQKKDIPCISVSDTNWFSDAGGDKCYSAYIQADLRDFRDNKNQELYGPAGTFFGHPYTPPQFAPAIVYNEETGLRSIKGNTIDVGFVAPETCIRDVGFTSKEVEVVRYFADYGAFDAETGDYIPNHELQDPAVNKRVMESRNFASDHALIGADICLKV